MVALPSNPESAHPLSLLIGQDIAGLLNQKTSPEEQLGEIVERLGNRLQVEICILAVGRPTEGLAHLALWTEAQGLRLLTTTHFWNYSWIRKISQSETPVSFVPLSSGAARRQRVWKLTQEVGLSSGAGVRLVFRGEVNGLLILGSPGMRVWGSEEKQILADLAPSLALASHLLESALSVNPALPRHKTNSLGTPAEDSPLVKVWVEATRHQLEQQRQANEQLIHNIVTIMSDQTRNPLATLRLGIEMLRKRSHSPEILAQRLDVLEQEWRKLNDINEKILRLRSLRSDPNTILLQRLEVPPLLDRIIQEFRLLWAEKSPKDLKLVSEYSAEDSLLQTNASHLQQIIRELLTNAEKFASPHSAVSVTLNDGALHDQPALEIQCRNLMSRRAVPKQLSQLFDPFYREQWVIDTAIPGIGLGLTIAKTLVEQLNGTIEVATEPLAGTDSCWIVFTLVLPGKVARRG
ncbi:MAG: ATP-binding protein [Cyanobacteriota bacterium]|jgi:signal transduction histidine kinase